MSVFTDLNLPPPGWLLNKDVLEEDQTVIGYMRRNCEVRGGCYMRDCRRTVSFEWADLVGKGQGRLFVRELLPTYRCGRLGNCSITWTEKPQRRITLGQLAGKDHVAVQIRCVSPKCKNSLHVVSVAAMIARLKAENAGGPDTDVKGLAEAIPTPCPRCQGKFWRTEILWHDSSKTKLPTWLLDLRQRQQEARFRKADEPMAPGPPPGAGSRPPKVARG